MGWKEERMSVDRFRLDDRVAIVTGASMGLGRAFAIAMADAGAMVACVDYDLDPLNETVAMIGDRAIAISADVSNADQVDQASNQILSWSGQRADILINNAGIATFPGRILDVPVEDWDRAVAVNLRSMFLVTRALMPALLESKNASIINLSSILGLVGTYPGFAVTAVPYAATKAAAIGFTRQLAIEYAKEHVRVNAIAPGWHGGTKLGREKMGRASSEDIQRFEDFISNSVPMGHRGTPDDLVGLVLYLASDASRYMTGQTFAHDGGVTAE
jgi:NAD(P)-dependent dehydrogenase (short-subunit alcohol dehydrogenase family)